MCASSEKGLYNGLISSLAIGVLSNLKLVPVVSFILD